MKSIERIQKAINHQQPDRVPIDVRFVPEISQKLLSELKMDEQQFWDWAEQDVFTVRPKFKHPASAIKYADPTIRIDEHGHYLDIYQVPFRKVENEFQTYLEPLDLPPLGAMTSVEDLSHFSWPQVDDWDYSQIEAEIEAKKDKALWPRSRGCFQTSQLMRGMEQFLIDLALEPEFACSIMDHVLEFVIEDARLSLEGGKGKYTFIEYNDDVATQKGMLISPAMWRKYVKPRMKAFCDMAHAHDVYVKYHSCGSVYKIIPDLIEIGVDILNPIQTLAVNMDPFKLKEEFGKDICFHGAIDIQELLPNGSVQEVKDYVRRVIDVVGKDGGYILAGSHTIQADAKVENIVAMLEVAKNS